MLLFPALELLVVVLVFEELGLEVELELLPRELLLEEPLEELELPLLELDELDELELLFVLPPFTSKRSWSSVSSIKLLRSKSLKSLFFIRKLSPYNNWYTSQKTLCQGHRIEPSVTQF